MARLALALSVALAIVASSPASAMQCMQSKHLFTALKSQGEQLRWQGISRGNLVMLLVHPTTNKWTVLATNPRAISCIIAFGDDGEMVPQATPIAPISPKPRNDR
jgi:hypothetical protein|tara:strand:- start:22819 stop:23133 length:315 start_codon:yes stop_codon:yes gene_type:complete